MISGRPADNQPDEPGEPLIDSLLEELLGGQSPPDLKAQILARLQQKRRQPAETEETLPLTVPWDLIPPELLASEFMPPEVAAAGQPASDGRAGEPAEQQPVGAKGPSSDEPTQTPSGAGPGLREIRARRPRVVSELATKTRAGRRRWSRERWRAILAGMAGVAACLLVVAGLAFRSTAPGLATVPGPASAQRPAELASPRKAAAPPAGERARTTGTDRSKRRSQTAERAAGPSNAGPSNAGPSNAGPSNAGPSNAGPSNAGPSNAAGIASGAEADDPWKTAKLRHLNLMAGDEIKPLADPTGDDTAGRVADRSTTDVALEPDSTLELAPFGSVPFQPLVHSTNNSLNGSSNGRPANSDDPSMPEARALSDEQIVRRVNELLEERWRVAGLVGGLGDADSDAGARGTLRADDEEWCERVYQQLLGRAPQPGERRDFQRDESPDKRTRLVDRLMTDVRYRREFVEFWAERWSDWLVGDASRPLQQGLKRYLANAFRDNRRYDTIWTELLTAAGTNQSGGPDHDDATNYLLALWEPSGSTVVEHMGRAAWGQRVGCAQCHDDTLNGMTHARFWQAAAVFQPLQVTNLGPGRQRLSEVDARGDDGPSRGDDGPSRGDNGALADRPGFREQGAPDERLEPADLEGRPLGARDEFAARLVQSPRFSRALVNRLWGHFLQYGLTQPVDDMGPHNPTELPGVLEELATQFERRGYQLEPLMRWMVLSEPFARGSAIPVGSEKDFPEAGGPALFSWYYDRTTPVFAEPSRGLLGLAQGAVPRMTDHNRENAAALVNARLADGSALKPKRSPAAAAAGFDAFDSPGRLVPVGYLRLVRALASSPLSPRQQVDHAVRVVLAREPQAEEVADAERIYAAAKGDSVVALERVFWVLLNSRD